MSEASSAMLSALREALSCVSEETMSAFTARIRAHRRVFFSASGRTGLMLRAFAMRLMQAGMTVFIAGDTLTPAIEAGDLLVCASASGSTPSVCRNAETALRRGAELYVICADAASPLARLHAPDVLLPLPDKSCASGAPGQLMGSLFEETLLLFTDLAAYLLADDPEALRRRHANLE